MRAFRCDTCGQLVFYENSLCLQCGSALGFVPSQMAVRALTGPLAGAQRCGNFDLIGCNWIVERPGDDLCLSCWRTSVRPADGDTAAIALFAEAERAKRRVAFNLLSLGLPIDDSLSFELKSSELEPVMTGHADGVITLDLAESDDARRAQRQEELGEPYRTLVGHFRHELGHYYQPILLDTEHKWELCRMVFGDERASYQDALDHHYEHGAPPNWQDAYVSAYATMHPWEDWAETFAHYLHIRSTLQTAADFGIQVRGPRATRADDVDGELESAPGELEPWGSFDAIMNDWIPLSVALNQLNRSMGKTDAYPFALSQPAIDKLTFMHLVIRNAALRDVPEEALEQLADA